VRFTVHRPGNPVASPCSHGVPRRDVPGRVHVSVAGVSAGGAPEDGLALTRLSVHLPACRAALARMVRLDLLHPAGRLILQAANQPTPPGPHDATVQSTLGTDVPARMIPGPLRRARHAPDLQVLDLDHVKSTRQVCAGLLDPVLEPIGLAGAQPGSRQPNLRAAFRAATAPGKLPFKPLQPLSLRRGQAGHAQQFTGRQGCRYCNAAVDAHDLSVTWCLDRLGNGGEGDVPAPCPVNGHSVGLHSRRYRPGPAEPHPTDLRHPNLADFPAEPTYLPLLSSPPHNPEPLVPSCLTPRRASIRIRRIQECGHRAGEIPEGLLLHRMRSGRQPCMLRPGLGELPALLDIAWCPRAARSPMRVLLDGQIPHVPGVRTVLAHYPLLDRRGEQPVSGHTNTVAMTTDISGGVKQRFLPGPKASASAPRPA
jgi:hypothetical protein